RGVDRRCIEVPHQRAEHAVQWDVADRARVLHGGRWPSRSPGRALALFFINSSDEGDRYAASQEILWNRPRVGDGVRDAPDGGAPEVREMAPRSGREARLDAAEGVRTGARRLCRPPRRSHVGAAPAYGGAA